MPLEDVDAGHTISAERLEFILSEGLDRLSPVPLYHQLAQNLRQAIMTGVISPGTTLGNEILLAESIGVGRPTLRQALQELVDAGLLVRRRGVGTQVVRPRGSTTPAAALHGLWDEMRSSNRRLTARVLEHSTAPAGAALSEVFAVDEDEKITTIRRLRILDGVPLALSVNRLPQRLAPDAARLLDGGLFDALRRKGIMLRVAQQKVSARLSTTEEAQLLGESSQTVLLVVTRTVFDDAGIAVTSGETAYLASRYELASTVVNR